MYETRTDGEIEELINLLQTGDCQARAESAKVLSEIRNVRAINPLINALKDEYSWVRYHATSALGNIRDNRAIDPLINVLKTQDYYIFRCAVFSLAKINGEQAIKGLSMSLEYSHRSFWKVIAQGLGMTGDERVIESLKNLLQDDVISIRVTAAYALGKINSNLAIDPLIDALQDRCMQVRTVAFQSLLRNTDDGVNSLLLMCFASKFGNIRNYAMYVISRMDVQAVIIELTNVLHKGKRLTRMEATGTLNGIIQRTDDENVINNAIDSLIIASKDRHSSIREYAARMLGNIPTRRVTYTVTELVIDTLTITLGDRSFVVRWSAITSLQTILFKLDNILAKDRKKRIVDILKPTIDKEYLQVREQARKLLNSLTEDTWEGSIT